MSKKEKRRPDHSNQNISRRIAELPYYDENNRTYKIGFDFYNEKLSNLKGAKAAEIRKVFEFMTKVGKCKKIEDFKTKIAQEIKPVFGTNEYKKYYSGLTEDVELKEFDAGTHRCFFFIRNAEKIVEIRAIAYHPENNKQFR